MPLVPTVCLWADTRPMSAASSTAAPMRATSHTPDSCGLDGWHRMLFPKQTASVLAAQTALCKVPLAWRLLICSFQRVLWEGFTLGEASPLCQELRQSLSSEAWLSSALRGKGKKLEDAASMFVLRWVFPLVLAPCSTG